APAATPRPDFLEQLEREREASSLADVPRARSLDEQVAVPVRSERSAGDSAARKPETYDANDLEIPSFLRRR
ncbi:MAG: hypothetical protein WCK58_09230, partial [Chloroflexota bacterium]